jgi:hypothetical protein
MGVLDKGAKLMLPAMPHAKSLTGDKGYDSDAFRKALIDKGIELRVPPKKRTARSSSLTMRRSTKAGTKSKTTLRASKTGGASLRAAIAARTPSSQATVSPPASSFIISAVMSPEPSVIWGRSAQALVSRIGSSCPKPRHLLSLQPV